MEEAERFRLHFGPYATHRFRYGAAVRCEVTICGLMADGFTGFTRTARR